MQFKQATAVFLVSLIGVHGTAIATRNPIPQKDQETGQELILLNSEITPMGNLTNWGLPDYENSANPIVEDAAHPDVHRRCGGNNVECTISDLAFRPVCHALAWALSDARVPKAPRSTCLKQERNQFCISWANEVKGKGMVYSDLFGGALAALNQCPDGDTISARVRDVNLRSICTMQCLSNNPNLCR